MSLYFELFCDEYEGKETISDIMDEVSKKLYKDYKLKLKHVQCVDQMSRYSACNNMVLHEEILYRNMTEDQKVSKFLEYVDRIGGIGGHFIIIDPYIFSETKDEDYKNFLQKILSGMKFITLKVITNKKHFDKCLFCEIKKMVNREIEVEYSDAFHDRFWIANGNKGFISGTSLNGVGKRYSLIEILSEEDVTSIMDIVNKNN